MPHLTAVTRRKLKYLPQGGQAPHGGQALACWNWALTGLGLVENNPDGLFSFVSIGPPLFTLTGANAIGAAASGAVAQGWYNSANNQSRLTQLHNAWTPYRDVINPAHDSAARRAVLHQICTELTKCSIELNGLNWSIGQTPYQLVMHYDNDGRLHLTRAQVNNGVTPDLYGPNYTHWWLQIDGGGVNHHNDGLEVFPGNANLAIRRPEYDSGPTNCRIYLTELSQDHVTRITNVAQGVIRNNHQAGHVPHGAWVDAGRCAICASILVPGITRHHCRCCGRTVCADCSPTTRAALAHGHVPKAKPNEAAGAGPYRVCLFCDF